MKVNKKCIATLTKNLQRLSLDGDHTEF